MIAPAFFVSALAAGVAPFMRKAVIADRMGALKSAADLFEDEE